MMIRWTMRVWVMVLITLLVGCTQKQTPTATPFNSRAEVTSVELLQVIGAPGELRALVRGNLPDGCTTLGEPVVDSQEQLIVVILPQSRTASMDTCSAGPAPYERTIVIGNNLTPGSYTVSVNGVQAVFTITGEATSTPSAKVDLSPTQTSTSTVETVVTPTNTATPTQVPPTQSNPTATPSAPTPSATPASNTNTGAPTQTTTDCINKAAFFSDITIPDGTVFDPGEAFTKTWQVRNAGTCPWNGYSLVFQDGDLLNAASSVKLVNAIAPGALAEISIKMTAPQTPGSYSSNWFFATPNGTIFGLGAAGDGALWAKIGVRSIITVTGGSSCNFTSDAGYESQVLALINDARVKNGLAPLTLNTGLSNAARGHSQDMACQDFVEHYGSDGSTWFTRIQKEGVKYHSASENIYAGNPKFGGTPEGAFNWWMNSQIHRDNILDAKATEIGIGYVHNNASTYKGYYTLDFTQP